MTQQERVDNRRRARVKPLGSSGRCFYSARHGYTTASSRPGFELLAQAVARTFKHRPPARRDAELSETDAEGLPILTGKVAVTGVVGNEDGAHKITADLYQALSDVGFSVPSQGGTYWNGEAMHTVDYLDLAASPDEVVSATTTAATNASDYDQTADLVGTDRHIVHSTGRSEAESSGTVGRRARESTNAPRPAIARLALT